MRVSAGIATGSGSAGGAGAGTGSGSTGAGGGAVSPPPGSAGGAVVPPAGAVGCGGTDVPPVSEESGADTCAKAPVERARPASTVVAAKRHIPPRISPSEAGSLP
jgi:hypothetical protein